KVARSGDFRRMGFETADEVEHAVLGTPLKQYVVTLDKLVKYVPTDDTESVLKDDDQFVFPVLVGPTVRSSVKVIKLRDKWQVGSIGFPTQVTSTARVRQQKANETGLPDTAFFAVSVPALRLFFIGYRQGGELKLAPIFGGDAFGFDTGATI